MKERLFPDMLFSDKKKTEEKNKVQSKLNSITRGHTASIFTLRLFEHLLLPGMEMAMIDSLWKSISLEVEDDVDGDVEPNNTADGTSYPTDGNSGSFGMASTADLEDAALMADVEKGNLDVKRQLLEDQKKKIDRYKESMQKIKT